MKHYFKTLSLWLLIVFSSINLIAQNEIVDNNNPAFAQILTSFYSNDTLIKSKKNLLPLSLNENNYSTLIRTDISQNNKETWVITDNVDGKHKQRAGRIEQDSLDIPNQTNESPFLTMFIPSVFTPNNDGINDRFETDCIPDIDNFILLIVNRWGETLYEADRICSVSWDGTYNNRKVNEGIYFYISYTGKGLKRAGTITVLR